MAARKKKTKESQAYNSFKEFEGQKYVGMKIGRSHKWYYDKGEWKETKRTPDIWEVQFNVKKRRAGKAPEGSGVPLGTEYHWYILAHQHVKKLDANTYSTELTGMKVKLAHKRAGKETWSVSAEKQRQKLISFLEETIKNLKSEKTKIYPLKPQKEKPIRRKKAA